MNGLKEEEASKEGTEEPKAEVTEEASTEKVGEKAPETPQPEDEKPQEADEGPEELAKDVQPSGEAVDDEGDPEVFDEDEKQLFERLMQKIQDAGDLEDGIIIGAQATPDQDGTFIQPMSIGTFEEGVAPQGPQNGHPQFGQPAGDPALLPSPNGGCRPGQDGALGGHEEQVGAEYLVG